MSEKSLISIAKGKQLYCISENLGNFEDTEILHGVYIGDKDLNLQDMYDAFKKKLISEHSCKWQYSIVYFINQLLDDKVLQKIDKTEYVIIYQSTIH